MTAKKSLPAKQSIQIHGKQMAYVDVGHGSPLIMLHGNPTSSYLWRDVIAVTQDRYRCLAPDLIGMGDSEKLSPSGPDRYTFVEHRHYLDAWIESMEIDQPITLVIHDWGSGLGFDWANRHRDRVAGICYMEAIVCPLKWNDWPEAARSVFQGFRSPAGEEMCLEKNVFIERVLPGSILRELNSDEMDVYREPFLKPGEDRRPTLTWPRQIPIDGEPDEVVAIVESYGEWLSRCDVPKLFINADPGAILIGRQREFCRGWPNQTEVTVAGNHFIQEDSGTEIGQAVADWRAKI